MNNKTLYIQVDYTEFQPETYQGVYVERNHGERIFHSNTGEFETDYKEATTFTDQYVKENREIDYIARMSSVDNYLMDITENDLDWEGERTVNDINQEPTISNEEKYKWALEVMAAYFKSPDLKNNLMDIAEKSLNGHPDQIEVYSTIAEVIEWEGYLNKDETEKLFINVDWNGESLSTYKGVYVVGEQSDKRLAHFNTDNFKQDLEMMLLFTDTFGLKHPETEVFRTNSVNDYESKLNEDEMKLKNHGRLKELVEKLTKEGKMPLIKDGALENLPRVFPIIQIPKPDFPKFKNN
jgi:hypothetical protein